MRTMPHTVVERGEILVVTGACPLTKKPWRLEVPASGYAMWHNGVLIQNALPGLNADERELLMTGITPEGWATLGSDEDVSSPAMKPCPACGGKGATLKFHDFLGMGVLTECEPCHGHGEVAK